jgi:hypothetical protein
MEPNTELARFKLPRDNVGLGDPGAGDSAIVVPSSDCFSPYCDMSERFDMKDAVRRFRSRLAGCDSSLVLGFCRPVSAVRPLRPKMLLRLSLDMPRVKVGDAPPCTSSAAQRWHAQKYQLARLVQYSMCSQNMRDCVSEVRWSSWSNVALHQ